MPRQTVPIGDFGKGITPSVSDKKTRGWKVMDNINQTDELGSVVSRNGLTASKSFLGGITAGNSIVTSQIQPDPADDPVYNTQSTNLCQLHWFGDWRTNIPEVFFNLIVNESKYFRSLQLDLVTGIGTWASSNPNAQMKLTLCEYVKSNALVGTFGQPGYGTIGDKYDFGATISTATTLVGNITSGIPVNFEFVNDNSIRLDPTKTYALKMELIGLTTNLSPTCSLQLRSINVYINNQSGILLRLQGGIALTSNRVYPTSLQFYRFEYTPITFTITGANVSSGYIDGTIHTALSSSAFIAITNADLRASTDKLTDRSIMPVFVNTTSIPYVYTPTYNMGDERYGISMVVDGETHYISMLSTLLHPTIGDGEIIKFKASNTYGTRLSMPAATPTSMTVFGYVAPTQGNRPAQVYQYATRYMYDTEFSELSKSIYFTTGVRPTEFAVQQTGWTNGTDGQMPRVRIPVIPNSSIAAPTGVKIYRRAVQLKNTNDDRIEGSQWQEVLQYDYPANMTSTTVVSADIYINVPNNTIEFTDTARYIVSGDYIVNEANPDIFFEDPGVTVAPTPGFIFNYNGRIFALGDKDNRSTVFFSKYGMSDFFADNTFTLDLPPQDFCLTAGFTLGGTAFVCSAHKIYRVIEVSDSIPYYKIEPVAGMDGLGCISPKSILTVGGLVYFMTSEGYVGFNGSNYINITTEIQTLIKGIDQRYVNSAGVEVNPWNENAYYAPYLVEAVYNEQDESIYLALPIGSQTINNTLLKYCISLKTWTTLSIPNFRGLLVGLTQGVDLRSDSLFMSLTDGSKVDTAGASNNQIVCTLESYDTVLPDQAQVNMITLYGTGTANVYIYMNRSTVPKITKLNVPLSEDGVDVPINRQGFEFRYKIESVNSYDFKMTKEPVVTVTGSGQRLRSEVK